MCNRHFCSRAFVVFHILHTFLFFRFSLSLSLELPKIHTFTLLYVRCLYATTYEPQQNNIQSFRIHYSFLAASAFLLHTIIVTKTHPCKVNHSDFHCFQYPLYLGDNIA